MADFHVPLLPDDTDPNAIPDGTVPVYSASAQRWVPSFVEGGGEGGTTNHALLTNRDAADQHPIGAITNLWTTLAGKADTSHTHNASDLTAGTVAAARLPNASSTARGIVELATNTEAAAGTDTARAVTPANMKPLLDAKAPASHTHDAADLSGVVKTVNGTGPDGSGNVVVSGDGVGGGQPVSHESINITADTFLPVAHPVLTVRATADATVGIEDAPDGTVITVHVAEGWEHITWAPGITVTGATDTTETWVVLVRTEGAWRALVSGSGSGGDAPAPVFDSGPVDLSHLLTGQFLSVPDTSYSTFTAHRYGRVVSLIALLRLADQAGGTYVDLNFDGPLPVGFRPSVDLAAHVTSTTAPVGAAFAMSTRGWGSLVSPSPGFVGTTDMTIQVTYITPDPEPAT